MKKIIGIILAVLMVFSMSTMAFAGFTTAPETPTKDYVKVEFVLEDITAIGTPDVFESHTIGGETTEVKGRTATFVVTITNKTEKPIIAKDALKDFNILAIDWPDGEVVFEPYEAKWNEAGDPLANAINPDGSWSHKYLMKIETLGGLQFKVENKFITTKGGAATFYLIEKVETITETTTAAPVETTTEVSTETTTVVTTAPTYVEDIEETGGDDYYEAPVEDEIPNTGSASVIGAVAALGLAAGAIILLKKKNK